MLTFADPEKAAQMAAYHKAERRYLGVANPVLDQLAKGWREGRDVAARAALADALWQTDIHEARVAAAKLLTQARMRPDDGPAWEVLHSWVPDFNGWAIADHACSAIGRRLVADPTRIDAVEAWTRSDHMWTRRAALVATLPWTKQNHPKPEEIAVRERVLGWAATYVTDPEWFIQKAVSWWVRDLSRHDVPRARAFLQVHGAQMKNFARKDASRLLPKVQ